MDENQRKKIVSRRKRKRKLAKRRKRIKKWRYILTNPQEWKWKKIVVVAGIVYISFKLLSQQIIIMDLKQEKVQRQENVKKLNNEIKDLTNKIENKTDIVYIERIARDDLKMVRPGELMYEDKDDLLK